MVVAFSVSKSLFFCLFIKIELALRVSVCNFQVLDDMFALEIQQLLGNALQEKDLQPPRSIMEVRAMLCKDAGTHKGNNYYY